MANCASRRHSVADDITYHDGTVYLSDQTVSLQAVGSI
jgi:hypothetical protein